MSLGAALVFAGGKLTATDRPNKLEKLSVFSEKILSNRVVRKIALAKSELALNVSAEGRHLGFGASDEEKKGDQR